MITFNIIFSLLLSTQNVLQELNFENLLRELNKKRFHFHGVEMAEILTSDTDDLFYVCCH